MDGLYLYVGKRSCLNHLKGDLPYQNPTKGNPPNHKSHVQARAFEELELDADLDLSAVPASEPDSHPMLDHNQWMMEWPGMS